MTDYLRTPDTPADTLRDTLLGALVGLARSTSSEPKTENTDAVLNAGLRLAAQPDAPAETLQRMLDITRAEKHAVAPNCATCAMPCGNTKDYDLTRLRSAAPAVRQRKLRLLQAVFCLAAQHPDADVQLAIYRGLFAFSEDWDEELLDPVIAQTEKLCVSGRKSLISAGKPEFPVPGRLPERFFALQILFPAGFARFFWKKALQMNRKKLLYK